MAHFHHFSICNQNLSKSISVIFGQNTKAIALLFGQSLAHFHHFSICNQICQSQFRSLFGQNTKAIALLFGQKWLIFITFQSAIKICQSQFRHFWAKYQGYSLTFWPKVAHFHHFSICNQNLSKSISGHFWAKYQGYSLTFWPIMAHFHHFYFSGNQHLSKSISVICGQNTKAIALLFGQKWLIFITFQSAIKICQSQFPSFLGKLPRL